MKKEVIYLSYDGLTDPLGQSQIIPYLLGLSNHYNIHVISFEKPDKLSENRQVIIEAINDNFEWIPLSYTKRPPIFSTVWDILKLKKACKDLIAANNIQLVHCRSYVTSLVGLELKRRHGLKFIFDMRGFWADERVDGGIWNLKNPLFRIVYDYFKKKEKEFLTNADCTISLTHNAKKEIHSWGAIPNQPIRIEVIPCCADLNLFDPNSIDRLEKGKMQKELEIEENDFVISYLGSIGTWYMLDEMLAFFKRLLRRKKNAKFLFISNESSQSILAKAKELGIDSSKIIIVASDRNEVPLYLSLSHISIFFIKPVFSKRASSPTKQAEIMGMGIPFVANSNVGDSNYFYENYEIGLLVNEFTDEEFDKMINEVDKPIVNGSELRKKAIDLFSLDSGVRKYTDIYHSLLQ